jgi:hypothetical protein
MVDNISFFIAINFGQLEKGIRFISDFVLKLEAVLALIKDKYTNLSE